MIKLIKTYTNILLTNKVIYIILGIIILISGLLISFSEFYLGDILSLNKDYYYEDYIFESITFIKIVIVLFNGFLVIISRNINLLDYIMIQVHKRMTVIVSKLLSLWLISTILILIMYVIFNLIGIFLTPYMNYIDITLGFNLILFSSFYLLISIYAYNIIRSNFTILGIFIIYFIGSVFTPYKEFLGNVSVFTKILNLGVNDLYFTVSNSFEFMYGMLYVLTIIILIVILIIKHFNKNDIIH